MRAFASRRLGDLWLWILRGLAIGFASRREGRRKLFALEGEVPSSAVDHAASLLAKLISAILEVLTALAGSLAQFRKGLIAFPGSEQTTPARLLCRDPYRNTIFSNSPSPFPASTQQ